MKKIAILTFARAQNYGGDLQAYSLQKKLSNLGYNVSVIQQLCPINKGFIQTKNFKPIINLTDKLSYMGKVNTIVTNIITSIASTIYFKRNNLRLSRFMKFENEKINLTEKVFRSFDQLYDENLPFDIFITGSDQVWNYTNGFSPEPFFLTFVKEGKKKISYAASIGHSVIPEEIQEKYKVWFNNIDFISTREEQAELLVKNLSGKPAITVLDPTFLFNKEEWIQNLNIQKDSTNPYLLIYTLSTSPYIYKLAQHISKIKKLRILRVVPNCWTHEHYTGVRNIYTAGPVEFISLFSNASFILTNSFHGTAFSINFNIPFFSIPRKNKKINSRFLNILKKTNLSERLLYDGDPYPLETNFDINFLETNKLLDIERKKSLSFLIDSIEN